MTVLKRLWQFIQQRTWQRRKIAPKVKAVLRDADGRVLLIQHPQEGRWRLPGGYVNTDESAYEAITRAVAALTGLRPLALQPFAREDESQFRPDAMYGDFFQMYATLFLVTDWQAGPQPAQSPWRWAFFAGDALPRPLHEEVARALMALQAFDETGQIKVT